MPYSWSEQARPQPKPPVHSRGAPPLPPKPLEYQSLRNKKSLNDPQEQKNLVVTHLSHGKKGFQVSTLEDRRLDLHPLGPRTEDNKYLPKMHTYNSHEIIQPACSPLDIGTQPNVYTHSTDYHEGSYSPESLLGRSSSTFTSQSFSESDDSPNVRNAFSNRSPSMGHTYNDTAGSDEWSQGETFNNGAPSYEMPRSLSQDRGRYVDDEYSDFSNSSDHEVSGLDEFLGYVKHEMDFGSSPSRKPKNRTPPRPPQHSISFDSIPAKANFATPTRARTFNANLSSELESPVRDTACSYPYSPPSRIAVNELWADQHISPVYEKEKAPLDTYISRLSILPETKFPGLFPSAALKTNEYEIPPEPPLKDFFHESAASMLVDAGLDNSMRSSVQSTEDRSLMKKLGLPSIPLARSTFFAAELTADQFDQCSSLWNLSSISAWIVSITSGSDLVEMRQLLKALQQLIEHHIPTMNWLERETVADAALEEMKTQGMIKNMETGVQFDVLQQVRGVFPQLTRFGCYSNFHATESSALHCYSSRCSITLPVHREVAQSDLFQPSTADWAAFYGIPSESLAEVGKRELKFQYAIHELITGEESFVRDLNILMSVFGESLPKQVPPIMNKQADFCESTFGSVKTLVDVNTKYLLEPFKARQKSQGPYINGVADILLVWLKHARIPYLKYSATYLFSDRSLRKERDSNLRFAKWFDDTCKDSRMNGTPHSFYFHRAIPRLARYGLLLSAIKTATLESSPEFELLGRCVTECNKLTSECNQTLARVEKAVELIDFKDRLQFKGAEEVADFKLQDPKRRIIRRGDVIRRGDYRLEWIDSHLIFLDNYLILSKIKKGAHGAVYYITKKPIPLDLLILESVSGEPVTKNSRLGVGTFVSSASPDKRIDAKRLSIKTGTSPTKSDLFGASVTALDADDRELMYPFKITHLGRSGAHYTFYASTSHERMKWKEAILDTKREYGSAIYKMNGEPFKLKVLAEYIFGYEQGAEPKLPIFSPGTAVDRALNESRERIIAGSPPTAIFRSRINCGVSFSFDDGKDYLIVGMEYGAFLFNGNKWKRCLELKKITQMGVIADLNVLLVLADKNLSYYDLDTVVISALKESRRPSLSPEASLLTGYRLSKHREVGYFSVGQLKDRIVVIYKHRENTASVLKVLEPIREKGQHARRSKMVFSRGSTISSTEYFREMERLSINTDSSGINMFKQTFVVSTSKGFELLSLDMKIPQTVPVMSSITGTLVNQLNSGSAKRAKKYTTDSLKKKLEQSKPISMFRISDKTLLLCYDELGVYMDNSGNITGPCIIQFICKVRQAAYQHPYLVVMDEEMIEIRRTDKECRLRQVITGKDIRLLDKKEGQLSLCLAHPKEPGRQLVVALEGNEFVTDDDNNSLAVL